MPHNIARVTCNFSEVLELCFLSLVQRDAAPIQHPQLPNPCHNLQPKVGENIYTCQCQLLAAAFIRNYLVYRLLCWNWPFRDWSD